MLRDSASCLVGLIAIESIPAEHVAASPRSEDDDATLAQFFAHLANLPVEAPEAAATDDRAPRVDRLPRPRRNLWVRHSRIAADLGSLKAELQRALGVARRRAARSPQTRACGLP
jgi:hypothetical protein